MPFVLVRFEAAFPSTTLVKFRTWDKVPDTLQVLDNALLNKASQAFGSLYRLKTTDVTSL